MKKDITIAIPTYNNDQDLWRCLYTLTLNTNVNTRVIVINNHINTKEIIDTLVSQEGLDHVEVVHKVENVGWMGGINTALDMADRSNMANITETALGARTPGTRTTDQILADQKRMQQGQIPSVAEDPFDPNVGKPFDVEKLSS